MATILDGVAAGGGIAIAPVYRLGESRFTVKAKYTDHVNHEVSRLHDSFSLARRELEDLHRRAHQKMGEKAATVIDAQLAIAKDQTFESEIVDAIQRYSTTAAWTASQRIDHYLTIFKNQSASQGNYYHSRGVALQDFKKRLLVHLLDEELPDLGKLDHRAIIVAHQLTPTDIIQLNPQLVAGIVTDVGGRAAHFLVMSKEMRFPTVVDTKVVTERAATDMVAIIDGTHGRVILQPTPQQIDDYQRKASQQSAHLRELRVLKNQETVSADGHHFEVAANLALARESDELATSGAEGVGLFRSEFLFLHQKNLPDEESQFWAYRKVLLAAGNQRVVIRTLDVGGDKQLPQIPVEHEHNPFLGMRGLRVSLAYPELFRTQLRALLRASAYGRLAIMFPMVATVDEFRRAQQMVDQEKKRLIQEGIPVGQEYEVGAMIEIPAAVAMADQLAQYADFFSIGTNDLIQYLFAVDRGNEYVASLYQSLHPAVLRAVKQTIDCAHAEGKWIGMCGEMATIPAAVPLLAAMGLDEFSVPLGQILPIRSQIRRLKVRQLQPLIHQALAAQSPAEVRALVDQLTSYMK
jgi:phosphoenolpyruvate-protein phosphotransferase (PTS system enzyme I)